MKMKQAGRARKHPLAVWMEEWAPEDGVLKKEFARFRVVREVLTNEVTVERYLIHVDK